MLLSPGSRVGHYEIETLLGKGGMGEVYLARDLQLERPVAIKLLLPELTQSNEHLRRFKQEARSTSTLNHPNILTIYDFGQFQSFHFIVSEFVKGQTLRQIMKEKRLHVAEALEIACQITNGLAAAHGAGIIHRDIKPENIIVRSDGYVKVLDFGLAKLTEPVSITEPPDNDSTRSNVKTLSGAVLGTMRYMSPEQLRGHDVDARADLWSVGVMLYEMIAGDPPFAGASPADVTVAILEKEPVPLTASPYNCSQHLWEVVARLLAKRREERYQTAEALLTVLRHLQQTVSSALGAGENGLRKDESAPQQKPFRSRLTRRGPLALGWANLIAVIAVIAIGTFAAWQMPWRRNAQNKSASEQSTASRMKIRMLVDTGNVIDANISPDGKYVVYATEKGDQQSLWVSQIASGSKLQLVPPSAVRYLGSTFSPDGNFVYSVVFEKERNYGVLYQVPVLGGVWRRIIEDLDSPISFSPDGGQFTFIRGYPHLKETRLFVAFADGSGEKSIATQKWPEYFGWQSGPAWSPDGQVIACPMGAYDLNMQIALVRIGDNRVSGVLPGNWAWIGRLAWLPDASGLIMTAKEYDSALLQIWHVSYPNGAARRITNDLNSYSARGIGVSADSRQLVTVQSAYTSSIWVAPGGDSNRARQISSGSSDGLNGVSWTPDGKLIYVSNAGGAQNIWIMNNDGGGQQQLTYGNFMNYHPIATPDGRYIVFVSNREGQFDIWRMNVNGTDPKRLTHNPVANNPQCSPDGQWVIYKSFASGRRTLWRVSIEGGDSVQVTESYTALPAVAPNGHSIACEYWDEQIGSPISLAVLPFSGGAPFKIFPPVPGAPRQRASVIGWSPESNALLFISDRNRISNLWSQPLDGTPARQVTKFSSDRIFWFDWSLHGDLLACARGTVTSNVVLMSDFDQR
jgi:eukaryotic-like serine/threonine-protein kinase